jgi:legumain
LTGNGEAAGGKTLKTGPKSKIFVNFSDHGAPGLIAFPYSYLYADAL